MLLIGQPLHAQQSETDRQALAQLRAKAEAGDAQSQFELGAAFSLGKFGVATNYAESVKWYRQAAELNDAKSQNALAWILATSANPAIRDGANAVLFAEKVGAATDRKAPSNLDTLAAAFAEAGQFEKAVSTQHEAIALLQSDEEKNDYRSRLKLYEAKTPYREKD